jgi:signal peptidase I
MSSFTKEVFSWFKSIVIALVLLYICRSFLFIPTIVHGESMMPNLQDGNRLIVSKVGSIHRFDEITFKAPDENANYVKRVIGLPGDTVEMRSYVLYINGKSYKETYLNPNRKPGVNLTEDFTLKDLTGKSKVPANSLFVLGDNRTNSKDSRYFGFISKNAVIGKVEVRFWPIDEMEVMK